MRNELENQDLVSMGRAAVEWAAQYYEGLRDRRVTQPTTATAVRGMLDSAPPQSGVPFSSLLDTVNDVVAQYSRHNAHPRFFGYVASPGAAIAAAASLIQATLNINVTGWRSGPVATEMEKITIGWLSEMIGYGTPGMGLLVSGGSMANLCGLAAGRASKGSGPVYCTEETHFSVKKATRLLGMGPLRLVPIDERQRMIPAALAQMIGDDRAAGLAPAVIIASAGTAGTGAVDPLAEIAAIAREESLWLHADGAYGALAAMTETARPLFAGLPLADSVSLDPHKWLYLPVGTGCILYRDAAAAHAAFSESAEYIRVVGLENDEAFAFWDYGPELSRPFRALPLWMLIRSVGVPALAAAIEENMSCARYFGDLISKTEDFELLTPVGLSIFCFRYHPRDYTGDLDALNEKVMLRLQQSGSSYLSNTRVRGAFALRGCVLNYRTQHADMDQLLEDLRTVL